MRTTGKRWAISFADICLLLLGFSLIAQVRQKDGAAIAEGIRSHLGGAQPERTPIDLRRTFEPGEAVIRANAPALGSYAPADQITIESRGLDRGNARFDAWELASARTAAIARAVAARGASPDHVAIDMAETPTGAQRLTIIRR